MAESRKHVHGLRQGLGLALLTLGILAQACGKLHPPQVPSGGEVPGPGDLELPRIDAPTIEERRPLPVDPTALPAGARAQFPAFDMDRIFVTLPPREQAVVTATQVRDQVITPILQAIGFAEGVEGLRLPPESGIEQARPSLAGVAELLDREYRSDPKAVRRHSFEMIDAFLGKREPTPEVEMALQTARGLSFAQYKADIERLAIQYPFLQVVGNVPIEHTLLLASRWEGQTVTSVRGTVIHHYSLANRLPDVVTTAPEAGVVGRASEALAQVSGVQRVSRQRADDGPYLVLLPYGNDAQGNVALRYAWRMILNGEAHNREMPFLLWMDAETSQILKLEPLVSDVGATGAIWRRDPGTGATSPQFFEVDGASGGQYTLQLAGVAQRVDYKNDGFDANDVSIGDSSGGSSATFAQFNQAPINDGANAVCATGGNVTFQQVNFFADFHVNWRLAQNHGIFTPFPTSAWNPRVESASAGCNAWSDMDYGACQGYYDAACPNYSTGTESSQNYMNFAHDNTVVSHELAHNSVKRFTQLRPANWCGPGPCSIPVGWTTRFHDLADAWADHVENTNCTAGWVAKNLGGVDASNNCQGSRGHVETGGLPRLHEVTVPFNPASPGDHFPEHRDAATGDYADMQIPSAALWQVRLGMRSKCRPSGQPQYFVRFTRALKDTGFFGADPGGTDLGIYRYLYDLQTEMVDQWATSGQPGGPPAFAHNGNHTTGKVLAGFAKTGLFLVPAVCIDGNPVTSDPGACPAGDHGADAVVDIDDLDLADDLQSFGIDHWEHDFLELGGPAPLFHAWTGPRYRFDGAGSARPVTAAALCNAKFRVEVSTADTFPPASTVDSGWITVDTDPTTAATPECYGTWQPDGAQWTALQAGGAMSRIYYRVRTRDAADGNERLSTLPGNGLWTVPPAYALITANGQSDY
jgi:hypothetical protein